jgi:putative ABC transport system substrate-binding protein
MRRRDLVLGAGAVFAAAPARAQQMDRIRRVAISMSTSEDDRREQSAAAAFADALGKLGWVAGRNLEIVHRWGAGDAKRMEANAGELVALAPDAILAKGGTMPALQTATSTIPIVFVVTGDAAALSYAGNFARPRGNITGFTTPESDLVGKRLELLRQIAPAVSRVLYLWSHDAGGITGPDLFSRIATAAKRTGIDLVDGVVETTAAIEHAIDAFARAGGNGLVVALNALTNVHRGLTVKLAGQYRLPGAYPLTSFAEDGGLFSYAFHQDEMFRQAAVYIDRILRGTAPADLPVQFPTRFNLVINLKTAKALGLTVPQLLLAQADEVIE